MADSSLVLLLAGAADQPGVAVARDVLLAGGKVAAAVTRPWQVEKLRDELSQPDIPVGALLVGLVGPRDAEAAAGFVKGAGDALGDLTHFAGASVLLRQRVEQREPAGDLEELLDANLHTNVTLARAALPGMRRRRAGTLAFATGPSEPKHLSTTCLASLAAMTAFAEALAADVGAANLQIRSVAAIAEESPQSAWSVALHEADRDSR